MFDDITIGYAHQPSANKGAHTNGRELCGAIWHIDRDVRIRVKGCGACLINGDGFDFDAFSGRRLFVP